MISDFVKGKKQYNYPDGILKGIQLHRAIDNFTDENENTAIIKEIFRPHYRLYSGAIVDIIYDYYLANDKKEFVTPENLFDFSQQTYALLHENEYWLEGRFGNMFPYMESQNWLFFYKDKEGIRNSFEGLRRRANYIGEMETAFKLFEENESYIQPFYEKFFGSVKKMAIDFIAHYNK